MGGKGRTILAAGCVAFLALGYGGFRVYESWRYQRGLEEVQGDLKGARYTLAARKLEGLLQQRPGSDELLFLVGTCEKARGRLDSACAAWGQIKPGSSWAAAAVRAMAAARVDQGRLAEAERILTTAIADPRQSGFELRRFLAPLYWQEGRFEEARRLVEENWRILDQRGAGGSELAVEHVRLHMALAVGISSIDAVRSFLDQANRLAPDDDRVWLGQANLALRQGDLAMADRLIGRCLEVRSDDPPVWRSRLEWAMAAEDVDAARQALDHLPTSLLTPLELLKISAWLAARAGDRAAEQANLERLLDLSSEDAAPFDRLAELAVQAGDLQRSAQLRRRKYEIDQVKLRFQELFRRDQPVRDAAELAELAARLGRRFEARAFYRIALAGEPGRADLKAALDALPDASAPAGGSARTAADLLQERLTAALEKTRRGPGAARPGPITPNFVDSGADAGLSFTFENGETAIHQIVAVSSGGVGLLDYDGDGWLDVYAIQGGPFPPPPDPRPADRLFRNRGDGTFEDVTARAGIDRIPGGYGHGVTVGDYDNDGRPDLFLTRFDSYTLLHNEGGLFRDVTTAAGLAGPREWPTSAAFADLDNDGDLDLYVCHYLKWDSHNPRLCKDPARGVYISCDPRSSQAVPDHLFRNDGGRFVDVTVEAGVNDTNGRGFGVVAVDVDDDGRMDLFVANDMTENYLFTNLGGMRFEEEGLADGVACNAHGGQQAGMGVAAGDLDGDGKVDLAVTNFYNESTTLFHNLGQGVFADHTTAAGLAIPSRTLLGFGLVLGDFNNDGRLDLLTANGHVNDYRPELPYQMTPQLLVGIPGGKLLDVSRTAGAPFQQPCIGRGLAVGDLDNDGRLDAILVRHREPLVFLHNQTSGGHALELELEGTRSNRDGVGARIEINVEGIRQTAWRVGGGSFLSANAPRIHLGLGGSTVVKELIVRWPSGQVDRHQALKADACYRIREAARAPVLLPARSLRP